MALDTHIEWTRGDDGQPGATWNVTTGCTKISDGCLKCYIDRTPPFRMAHRKFDGPNIGATTGIQLHPERLTWPSKWRRPRRIFVDSLADLFHDEVPDQFIVETFAAMALAPQHTFQVLTKRHARMRSLLSAPDFRTEVQRARLARAADAAPMLVEPQWPLRHVWLGVSVENQQWADIRVPALLDTPAAVRWLSCEPLLGPVDLQFVGGVDALQRDWIGGPSGGTGAPHPFVDWVVVGGESGPGARPTDLDWIRAILDQCRQAAVPAFVKQLGRTWGVENGAGNKGGNWNVWPDDLRVRQYPTLRV